MALFQSVPVFFNVVGDGASTTYKIALTALLQGAFGGSVQLGPAIGYPGAAIVNNINPFIAGCTAAVDANGNLTVTFGSAPTNGVQYSLEVDLQYTTNTLVSSTTVPSVNVNITGGSSGNSAASATGSAVPANADYIGVNIAGNLVGVTGLSLGATTRAATVAIVDGSGNQITSFSGGSQFAMGSAQSSSALGTIALGYDGTDVRGLAVNASGQLQVVFPSAQAVTLTSTTITGTVAVTQNTSPWVVGGTAAQGAAPSGNPVLQGAVFNTTQPTVTNNQVVDLQATARGGLICATGVDTFNVTVNAALPAGGNTIGAVTQASGPWTQNLTQVAGTVLGATAVTNFGSAPAAAAVPGVNANIYSAGAAITAAAPLAAQLSQGGAVLSNTNPIFSSITDGTTKVTVIAATAALKTDLSSVAGTATVTAAAGVQKVGIVGNANATLDSTNTAATAPANALLTSAMYNSTVPVLTTGQAVAAECDTAGSLYQNSEGRKQTYRCGVAAFTPLASTTKPSISVTGSATKGVRITRIVMSCSASTGAIADLYLYRFSALSGGTANSQSANIAKMASGNAAATAVINQWSVAATTATSAGIINMERYEVITAAVSVLPGRIEWTFGDKNGQSLFLSGTSEFAGFCFSAVGTTPVADCWIEWTEE